MGELISKLEVGPDAEGKVLKIEFYKGFLIFSGCDSNGDLVIKNTTVYRHQHGLVIEVKRKFKVDSTSNEKVNYLEINFRNNAYMEYYYKNDLEKELLTEKITSEYRNYIIENENLLLGK